MKQKLKLNRIDKFEFVQNSDCLACILNFPTFPFISGEIKAYNFSCRRLTKAKLPKKQNRLKLNPISIWRQLFFSLLWHRFLPKLFLSLPFDDVWKLGEHKKPTDTAWTQKKNPGESILIGKFMMIIIVFISSTLGVAFHRWRQINSRTIKNRQQRRTKKKQLLVYGDGRNWACFAAVSS